MAKKTETKKVEEKAIVSENKDIKIEEIEKDIKNKKNLPKEEIEKINKSIFVNIMIAIFIVIYFIFLNLGYLNIKNDVYVTDLKVFSMCILFVAIVLIEKAYKEERGEIAIYGIEMIILAITTLILIYVNLMFADRYLSIALSISYIFEVYYLIKSIVIYLKKKKEYFVKNMKEIIKKEE